MGKHRNARYLSLYLQVPLPDTETQDTLPQPAQEGRHVALSILL